MTRSRLSPALCAATSAKQTAQTENPLDQSIILLDKENLHVQEGTSVVLKAKVQGSDEDTRVSWYTQSNLLCEWHAPDKEGISVCAFEASYTLSTIYVEMVKKSGETRIGGWNVDLFDPSADADADE